MKTKYYKLNIPIHLKKYLETKFKTDERGNVLLAKTTSLALFIRFGLKTIPFPVVKKVNESQPTVKIKYFDETFGKFIPHNSDQLIIDFVDRLFREELIAYVSGCHQVDGEEYTAFVWAFLERYSIERDEDIPSETARKIYRDYLEKNLKFHQKTFQ